MRRRCRRRARSRPGRTRGFGGRHPNPIFHAGGICLPYAPTVCYPCCVAHRNALRRGIPNPVRNRDADSVPHSDLHYDLRQPVREHAHHVFHPHPHSDARALLHANPDRHLHALRDAHSIRFSDCHANSVSYAIPHAVSDAIAHRHSESVGLIDRRHG